MAIGPDGKLQPLSPDVLNMGKLLEKAETINRAIDINNDIMDGKIPPNEGLEDPSAKMLSHLIKAFSEALIPEGLFKQSLQDQNQMAVGLLKHLVAEMELTATETRGNSTFGGLIIFIQALMDAVDTYEGFEQLHSMLTISQNALDAKLQAWLRKEILAGRDPMKHLRKKPF